MREQIKISEDCYIIDNEKYYEDVNTSFTNIPIVAKLLMDNARVTLTRIKDILYATPSFINVVKASIPEEAFQVILTDEQKEKIAKGALKLMTKKDGTLMANLVNPKTNKIVSTVSLKSIKLSSELSKAITDYTTQMQLAQIAEQMQIIHLAIEEVHQEQEHDRLATAFSCQQKLLQAMKIKNPELKVQALLQIALDAEDSRNILMQSQSANVSFIKNQPESYWGKFISGANKDKINSRMNEIRDSLTAVNIVSLTEAIAYQEMGEKDVAYQSLEYYGEYIKKTYLDDDELVKRLDLIDPSPENYWSKTLPIIENKIRELSTTKERILIGEEYGV